MFLFMTLYKYDAKQIAWKRIFCYSTNNYILQLRINNLNFTDYTSSATESRVLQNNKSNYFRNYFSLIFLFYHYFIAKYLIYAISS